ncbi:MAG: RDD family protein [Betaproteobacteria bacterium]|nr:RDD family protein [Betaproteobacteria bacterium]
MYCSSCGTAAPVGARFCLQCGVAIPEAVSAAPAATIHPASAALHGKASSEIPFAQFLHRLAAGFGDAALVFALHVFLVLQFHGRDSVALPDSGTGLMIVSFLWLGYWPIFEASSLGATPVARMLGLRVTDLNGNRIGFRRASWLHLFRLAQLILLPPLGWLMAGASPRHQTLANLMSGTLLLRRTPNIEGIRDRLPPAMTAGSFSLVALLATCAAGLALFGLWVNMDPAHQVDFLRILGVYPPDEPLLSGSGGKP